MRPLLLAERAERSGTTLGRQPIQVGLPCPPIVGKEPDRLLWRHHPDRNSALSAVTELRRADQLHLAVAVQAVIVGVGLVWPVGTGSPGMAMQDCERGVAQQPSRSIGPQVAWVVPNRAG